MDIKAGGKNLDHLRSADDIVQKVQFKIRSSKTHDQFNSKFNTNLVPNRNLLLENNGVSP